MKKISSHITKKVGDRLSEIFKKDRVAFEEKWDDLKIFIEYGMLTEEKFYEKAKEFALFKNNQGKYFTLEEYKELITPNQTDKDGQLVCLYSTNSVDQHSFIEAAESKGYDVILLEGHLDTHFVNHIEHKLEKTRFVRVDSDVVDKLIPKDEKNESKLSADQKSELTTVFSSQLPNIPKSNFIVTFEDLKETDVPVMITQNEFMRRMKEMSAMQGGGMMFYGDMPDSYNIVVNSNHPLIDRIVKEEESAVSEKISPIKSKISALNGKRSELEKAKAGKKEEEIAQADKDELAEVSKKIEELNSKRDEILKEFGRNTKLISQLIDLALLSNNMLKGESLTKFVKRSIELI